MVAFPTWAIGQVFPPIGAARGGSGGDVGDVEGEGRRFVSGSELRRCESERSAMVIAERVSDGEIGAEERKAEAQNVIRWYADVEPD